MYLFSKKAVTSSMAVLVFNCEDLFETVILSLNYLSIRSTNA